MGDALRLAPGVQLDRYELLCAIARGGMAQVWAARFSGKRGFEKLVVIKTILAEHAGDPRAQRMFLDEARVVASIHHPNVSEILDLGEERGHLFLVLEHVEGDTLAAVSRAARKRRQLDLGVALRVVSDVCQGLHAAHEIVGRDGEPLGVVHRDVSPQNVLCGTSGQVKVIDFGIAKALGRRGEATLVGQIKGKLSYMAPEQALRRPLDRRADIWSTGAVLYELVTGSPPYVAATDLETLQRLARGTPPPLPEGVPGGVARVLERALAHDPEQRFPTAEAMHGAIEELFRTEIEPVAASDVARAVRELVADRIAARQARIQRALAAADGGEAAEPPEPSTATLVDASPPVGAGAPPAPAPASAARTASTLVPAPVTPSQPAAAIQPSEITTGGLRGAGAAREGLTPDLRTADAVAVLGGRPPSSASRSVAVGVAIGCAVAAAAMLGAWALGTSRPAAAGATGSVLGARPPPPGPGRVAAAVAAPSAGSAAATAQASADAATPLPTPAPRRGTASRPAPAASAGEPSDILDVFKSRN